MHRSLGSQEKTRRIAIKMRYFTLQIYENYERLNRTRLAYRSYPAGIVYRNLI